MGENAWWTNNGLRIAGGMLDKLKYIAVYRTAPTSAITHWAEIKQIEPYGEGNAYRLIFKGPAKEFKRQIGIKSRKYAPQNSRYTNFQKLKEAKDVSEL